MLDIFKAKSKVFFLLLLTLYLNNCRNVRVRLDYLLFFKYILRFKFKVKTLFVHARQFSNMHYTYILIVLSLFQILHQIVVQKLVHLEHQRHLEILTSLIPPCVIYWTKDDPWFFSSSMRADIFLLVSLNQFISNKCMHVL